MTQLNQAAQVLHRAMSLRKTVFYFSGLLSNNTSSVRPSPPPAGPGAPGAPDPDDSAPDFTDDDADDDYDDASDADLYDLSPVTVCAPSTLPAVSAVSPGSADPAAEPLDPEDLDPTSPARANLPWLQKPSPATQYVFGQALRLAAFEAYEHLLATAPDQAGAIVSEWPFESADRPPLPLLRHWLALHEPSFFGPRRRRFSGVMRWGINSPGDWPDPYPYPKHCVGLDYGLFCPESDPGFLPPADLAADLLATASDCAARDTALMSRAHAAPAALPPASLPPISGQIHTLSHNLAPSPHSGIRMVSVCPIHTPLLNALIQPPSLPSPSSPSSPSSTPSTSSTQSTQSTLSTPAVPSVTVLPPPSSLPPISPFPDSS